MEVKICAISDIHGSLIDIPECDILCICGDILPLDIQRKNDASVGWLAGTFQKWLLDAPCKYVVMIWGNHDFIGQKYEDKYYTGDECAQIIFQNDLGPDPKIYILSDDSIELMGIKFYGTSWCPELKNWAFYADSENLKTYFDMIPCDTDVILTHCPPKFGQQGIVLQPNSWNFGSNFGCQELQDAIEKKFAVKSTSTFILSGHIHSGNHCEEVCGGLVYRNVSIKDENYEPVYLPKTFTIYV